VEIYVLESQAEKARRIIAEHLKRKASGAGVKSKD